MILINVRFPVREDKMDEWLALADSYAKAVNAEEGCVYVQLLAQPGRPEPVHLRRALPGRGGGRGARQDRPRREVLRRAPDLVSAQPEILYIDSPEVKGFGPMGEIQPR